MISLDGSYLEGGGAIVRVALALSTLKKEIIEIDNIRHGRPKPGLKAQHLNCINALKILCSAKTNDLTIGSENLKYIPDKIKTGNIKVDIGTAGSITLLLQSIMMPCIFAKKAKITITGGTDVSWSPSIDYFANVLVPQLSRFADIKVSIGNRGYYPKGGGQVVVRISPKSEYQDINLVSKSKLLQIKGISHASDDLESSHVAERQAKAAETILSSLCPVRIRTEYSNTLSTGSGITLWAIYGDDTGIDFTNPVILGSDSLGQKGKKAELVGQECAEKLLKEIKSDAAVDIYLADQLIPYLGLSGGQIKSREISMHAKTNIWVVEEFLGKRFTVDENIISTITL